MARAMSSLPVPLSPVRDRKSTRLNSSHDQISYAVFCLKNKKRIEKRDLVAKDDLVGLRVRCVRRDGKSPQHVDLLEGRVFSFFFNDTATTEIYTLSLHDALPI